MELFISSRQAFVLREINRRRGYIVTWVDTVTPELQENRLKLGGKVTVIGAEANDLGQPFIAISETDLKDFADQQMLSYKIAPELRPIRGQVLRSMAARYKAEFFRLVTD